jgi:hypothetical protein
MMLFYHHTQLYLWEMGFFFDNWIRFISAKSCSVDFTVSKLILRKYSQLVYKLLSYFIKRTKPVAIQNLNLLYKKYSCLVETEGVWII